MKPQGVEHGPKPEYREYHPRWYRQRVSTYWWMERWSYRAFILRELSSVAVAWFVVYFLMLVAAVIDGETAYREFVEWSAHPVVLVVNVVGLLLVVFHAVTWFNLAPQAMVVNWQGKRVPGSWIAGSNYFAWALVSGLVAWLILR